MRNRTDDAHTGNGWTVLIKRPRYKKQQEVTMPLRDHDELLMEYLDTPEAIAVYLNEAFETDREEYVQHALDIVRRIGVSRLSRPSNARQVSNGNSRRCMSAFASKRFHCVQTLNTLSQEVN